MRASSSSPPRARVTTTAPFSPPRAVFFFDVITHSAQHLAFVAVLLAAAWKWKADLRPTQAKYATAATALMLASNVLVLSSTPMRIQAAVVFLAEWGLLITWATMIFNDDRVSES